MNSNVIAIVNTPALLVAIALSLGVAGCVSPGRNLDVAAVKQIVPGSSTRVEVERAFGQPREFITGTNGWGVGRYMFPRVHVSHDASWVHRRLNPGQLIVRSLSVVYDTARVVRAKLHDESVTQIRQELGWYEAGPRLEAETMRGVAPIGSRSEELISRLGEPMQRLLDPYNHTLLVWIYIKDRADYLGQAQSRS